MSSAVLRETGRGGGLTNASGGGGSRRGVAGGFEAASCWCWTAGDLPGLEGRRGGNAGFGGCSICRPPVGLEPAPFWPIGGGSFICGGFLVSCCRLLGGRGGRLAGSYAGGSFRDPWLSFDSRLVLEEDTVLPAERFDAIELYETSDEEEFRRGAAGVSVGCKVVRRGGSAGVGAGATGWVTVRVGSVGGRGVVETWGGAGGAWLPAVGGRLGTGGLAGTGGRAGFDTGGGGGGARLGFCSPAAKFFCEFKAAIRSARVVSRGSSTSAMVAGGGRVGPGRRW